MSDNAFDPALLRRATEALRTLPVPDEGARQYLEKHIPRLAATLALIPPAPPNAATRALELGCYMQITPFIHALRGYTDVRGAYYGPPGRTDRKTIPLPEGEFACLIDHFDAERDPFPYPDNHFDLVIAGEILEHMIFHPMALLCESRRVLREGACLLVSTPNSASLASIAKALNGRDNPMIFPLYKRPDPHEPEIGHVHEYTAWELGQTVTAAGFEIERLFTTPIDEYKGHAPLLRLLKANGFSTDNRGEQTWCLARKRSHLPVTRFPSFLYSQ